MKCFIRIILTKMVDTHVDHVFALIKGYFLGRLALLCQFWVYSLNCFSYVEVLITDMHTQCTKIIGIVLHMCYIHPRSNVAILMSTRTLHILTVEIEAISYTSTNDGFYNTDAQVHLRNSIGCDDTIHSLVVNFNHKRCRWRTIDPVRLIISKLSFERYAKVLKRAPAIGPNLPKYDHYSLQVAGLSQSCIFKNIVRCCFE